MDPGAMRCPRVYVPPSSPRYMEIDMQNLETLFAEVIACKACDLVTCPRLLRDNDENVPQPGFVGREYAQSRVMLVGQNPAVPPERLRAADQPYTAALRALRDNPSVSTYEALSRVLRDFVTSWPIHGTYFPLGECGLTLDDIAYCNLVRCRTSGNTGPPAAAVRNCVSIHFDRWMDVLQPRVVVFIGMWALEHGGESVRQRGLPCDFINRNRSLNQQARLENREHVAQLVSSLLPAQE